MKTKLKGKDALLFIDTNIFLNFYRTTDNKLTLQLLKYTEECADQLILSSQLEMEYKANRVAAVLKGLRDFGNPNWAPLALPAITSGTQPANMISDLKKKVNTQKQRLEKRVEKV